MNKPQLYRSNILILPVCAPRIMTNGLIWAVTCLLVTEPIRHQFSLPTTQRKEADDFLWHTGFTRTLAKYLIRNACLYLPLCSTFLCPPSVLLIPSCSLKFSSTFILNCHFLLVALISTHHLQIMVTIHSYIFTDHENFSHLHLSHSFTGSDLFHYSHSHPYPRPTYIPLNLFSP